MTRANVKYTGGMQFVASADSGHAVVMDADADVGGSNTGSRPMELLLMGIGGCSGMDIISILKKKKQTITPLSFLSFLSVAFPAEQCWIHSSFFLRAFSTKVLD